MASFSIGPLRCLTREQAGAAQSSASVASADIRSLLCPEAIGSGQGPGDRGRAVRLSVVGVLLFIAGIAIGAIPQLSTIVKVAIGLILAVLAIGLQYSGWPKLFNVLLAYGFASRIPVLIVMFLAMRGDWQTHYDAVQPQFPA